MPIIFRGFHFIPRQRKASWAQQYTKYFFFGSTKCSFFILVCEVYIIRYIIIYWLTVENQNTIFPNISKEIFPRKSRRRVLASSIGSSIDLFLRVQSTGLFLDSRNSSFDFGKVGKILVRLSYSLSDLDKPINIRIEIKAWGCYVIRFQELWSF